MTNETGDRRAPANSLPTWSDCSIRIDNEKYLQEVGEQPGLDADALLPHELHRFIYEYDDADAYKSAWFMHRLEKLIDSIKAESQSEIEVLQVKLDGAVSRGQSVLETKNVWRDRAIHLGWRGE